MIAPFWDDLHPGATGSVHAGIAGAPGSRVLHIEWFNVPHYSLSGSGTATFEVALHEATGEIRYQWQDTDLGNPTWNQGASATSGVERVDGVVGRQMSFNQPLLTNGRAVSCTFGAPPPPPVPTITTASLPGGTAGMPYSATLQATNGTPPYTWSLDSGSLPAGLTLNSSTGAITGTPTAAGTSPFTAKVTDSASRSDTQPLSVAVAPAPVAPPSITTTSLPDGTVGTTYGQTLAAVGGTPPYTWSVSGGELPPGLTLFPTGELTQHPTSAGSFTFTVRVEDAGTPSQSDTQELTLTIDSAPVPPPTITTTSLPGGTVGTAYGQSLLAVDGTTPYTWSLQPGSSLPPGLSLSAAGVIAGTPSSPGTRTLTVQVTDSATPAGSDTQQLSITVVVAPLAITTTSLPPGTVGAAYSQTLAATGGVAPYTWTRTAGKLPNGLTLNSSAGTITGTPGKRGTYTFTIRVTDSQGVRASRSFTIQINRP